MAHDSSRPLFSQLRNHNGKSTFSPVGPASVSGLILSGPSWVTWPARARWLAMGWGVPAAEAWISAQGSCQHGAVREPPQASWSERKVWFSKHKPCLLIPEIGNGCQAGRNSRWKSWATISLLLWVEIFQTQADFQAAHLAWWEEINKTQKQWVGRVWGSSKLCIKGKYD